MYNLPQEIEVWYIIPAIRKEFAKVLVKKHRLTFEKAGGILGVSKAAVSQYLNKKRANLMRFTPEIKREIEKSAKSVIKNNNQAVKEIIKILNLIKQKKCACSICKKYNKGILNQCKGKLIRGE